jgi:hypothetical protein
MFGSKLHIGSSEADTFEFNQAIAKIQREWAERGLVIPDPNEKDYRLGGDYKPPSLS